MKLTTNTQVSVDGVMQGNGGADENRSGGFERGGWARPPLPCTWSSPPALGKLVRWLLDNQLVDEIILLVCPVVVGQGTRLFPDTGPDMALHLVDSRAFPKGITLQVYRPAGRPQYAT
jgi:RibD C-terminal domain